MEKNIHQDCENYTTIDVFKGLCRRDKEMKMADEVVCDDFIPVKQCRFCKHYTTGKEFLGMCMGKTMVYPDLLAKKCNDFEWHHE